MAFANLSYEEYEKSSKQHELDTVSQIFKQFGELVTQRRSVKVFDNSFKMPIQHLEEIISAASYAPSAFNIQHWRIIRVEDKDIKGQLHTLSWKQPQILSASEVLVLCMDLKAWQREPLSFCHSETEQQRENFIGMLNKIYSKNTTLQRDEAIRSVSLFSMILMLKAESMGYQSCPMSGFDYGKTAELLELAEGVEPCMIITLGKEDKSNNLQDRKRLTVDEILSVDRY